MKFLESQLTIEELLSLRGTSIGEFLKYADTKAMDLNKSLESLQNILKRFDNGGKVIMVGTPTQITDPFIDKYFKQKD